MKLISDPDQYMQSVKQGLLNPPAGANGKVEVREIRVEVAQGMSDAVLELLGMVDGVGASGQSGLSALMREVFKAPLLEDGALHTLTVQRLTQGFEQVEQLGAGQSRIVSGQNLHWSAGLT